MAEGLARSQPLNRLRLWVCGGSSFRRDMLMFCAGGLGALGFAPYDLWFLMPCAFVALIWLTVGAAGPCSAFRLGWWFAFGQFLMGLIWIAEAFNYQDQLPPAVGYVAVLLLSAFLALYGGLATVVARLLAPRGLWRPVGLGIGWTAAELLRGHLFSGFPWNLVGMAWLPLFPLAQTASLVGVYGLSLLMALTGGALALLGEERPHRWPALVLTAVLALCHAYGAQRLSAPETAQSGPVRVVAAQANIGETAGSASGGGRNLFDYLALSRQAPAPSRGRIIVWPEGSIRNLIGEEPGTRVLMGQVAGDGLILSGGVSVDYDARGMPVRAFNSLYALDGRGRILARYDKARLVPFGEFLPFRSAFQALGLSALAAGALDFSHGPGPRTLHLPGYPSMGVLICYEIIFPGAIVARGDRPSWLLNISDDAWFGHSSGPHQHLAQARMRAIEEGLPIVRATTTGISAIIDAKGRLVRTVPLGKASLLGGALPAPRAPTPYSQNGNGRIISVLLLLTFACVVARKPVLTPLQA